MAQQIPPELKDLRKKEFLEEKRRQWLRESNHELREIEKHLRTAYFVKSLKEQQQELSAKKHEAMREKEKESLEIEAQLKRNEELIRQREIEEKQKKHAFRELLQTQMGESIKRRQDSAVDLTRDRDHLEKLLQRLKLEEDQEKRELELRRESMKQELEDFMKQKEANKRGDRIREEQDRLRALEVQRQRDEEKQRIEEMKRKERSHQAAISDKIGHYIHKTEVEKRRREQVMLELLEEERKAKEDHRFRENLERQVRARERVRFELETYIEKRKVEKELERRNRLSVERTAMERLIEQSEKEAQNEIKRLREKEQEYNKSIQGLLEERRKARQSSAADHLRDYEAAREEERKMQEEVEKERMRLLQQHSSSDILRYLPSGVLRDSDREFLALPPGGSSQSKR